MRLLILLVFLASGCQLIGDGDAPTPEPCSPQPVVRGPWAVGYHMTQADIRWETEVAGCGGIRLRRESGGEWLAQVASSEEIVNRTLAVGEGVLERPDIPGPSVQHRVNLQNLEPGTCYQYQISQTAEVVTGRFCTAPRLDSRSPLRFALIGDTNPAMGTTAGLYQNLADWTPSAILHAGDIQYYDSFIETWADWFVRSEPLLRSAAILPVVGNHELEVLDERLEPEGTLPRDFTEYYQPMWGDHGHSGPGNNYAFRMGGLLVLALDSEWDPQDMWTQEVQQWVVQTLVQAESDPSYRFAVVMFHRPLMTRSRYGGQTERRAQFVNLVAPFRVKLILSGHAHCYERFIDSGRTWIVSGGGGALPHRCDQEHEDLALAQQAAHTTYHWVGFTLTASGLTGEVFDADDQVIDRFEIGG